MGKCNKCKEEIYHLLVEIKRNTIFEKTTRGYEYGDEESQLEEERIFFCSECEEIIATNQSEAEAVLGEGD